MSTSPEMLTKVAEWRQKARDGTLTRDEMRDAITFLRAERVAMPQGKAKIAKSIVSGEDLLSELDGI